MLVMVVFFIAFRWIHMSTPLIRLFLLVLILLLMPTLNFLTVWIALSLLRFLLPSRLPMMVILWMVDMMVVIIPSWTVCLFFKQKAAYEITRWLEFRRVLFRSQRGHLRRAELLQRRRHARRLVAARSHDHVHARGPELARRGPSRRSRHDDAERHLVRLAHELDRKSVV